MQGHAGFVPSTVGKEGCFWSAKVEVASISLDAGLSLRSKSTPSQTQCSYGFQDSLERPQTYRNGHILLTRISSKLL